MVDQNIPFDIKSSPYYSIIKPNQEDPADQNIPFDIKKSPYFSIIQNRLDEQAAEVRHALGIGMDTPPAVQAKHVALSEASGMPVSTIENNQQDIEKKVKLDSIDYVNMLQASPHLAQWIKDNPSNPSLAQNDVHHLGTIDTLLNYGEALWKGAGSSTNEFARSVNEILGLGLYLYDPIAGRHFHDQYSHPFVDPLSEHRQAFELRQGAGIVEKVLYGISSLAETMAQAILSSPVRGPELILDSWKALQQIVTQSTRMFAAPSISAGVNTGLDVYEKTQDPVRASLAGLTEGVMSTGNAIIPVSMPGRLVSRLAAGSVAGLVAGEAQRQVMNNVLPKVMQMPLDTDQAIVNALSGSFLGGVMGPGIYSNSMKAVESKRATEFLKKLNEIANKTEILKLSPRSFKEFVKQASKDGPVDTVFIDSNTLLQSPIAEDIISVSPAVADQISNIQRTGEPVDMPISIAVDEYMAKIVPLDQSNTLINDLKIDPGGFSRNQAMEYIPGAADELQSETKQILANAKVDDEFKASAKVVHDTYIEHLAKASQFSKAVNKAHATVMSSFYAVTAARVGMTPEELYNQYPLIPYTEEGWNEVRQNNDYIQTNEQDYALAAKTIADNSVSGIEKGGVYEAQGNTVSETPVKGSVHPDKVGIGGKVRFQKVSDIATGITKVEDSSDAAHLSADLRKEAQEHLLAIVLDKDKNVISVIRHSIGLPSSSQVSTGLLAGSIASVPGADSYYLSHNHPAGVTGLSKDDLAVYMRIDRLTKSVGINGKDIIAVTGLGEYEGLRRDLHTNTVKKIPAKARLKKVTLNTRRIFSPPSKLSIDNGAKLKKAAKDLLKGKTGVILTDSHNHPVGVIEISMDNMKRIIGTDAAKEYLKAIHSGNATAQFLVIDDSAGHYEAFTSEAVYNMLGLGNAAELRTVDALNLASGSRSLEIGINDFQSGTKVFHQDSEEPSDLYVVHNLSEENLAHSDRMGGIAAPSMAVNRIGTGPLSGFGGISLIAGSDLINSGVAKTFNADGYTPRYPSVERVISYDAFDKVFKSINDRAEKYDVRGVDIDTLERNSRFALDDNYAMKLAYLVENGKVPKVVMKKGTNNPATYINRANIRNRFDLLSKRYRDEYHPWVMDMMDSVTQSERILDKITDNGRRYLPHNLDTVVRIMKRALRDGEGMNYGLGSVRSVVAKQFKSIAQIKKSRKSILSEEDFDKVREEIGSEYLALSDEFDSTLSYSSSDAYDESLKELGKYGRAHFKKAHPDVPDKAIDHAVEFLAKLRNMPTEYFETKMQRAVKLSEFSGAVVPWDVSLATLELLKKHGLDVVRYNTYLDKHGFYVDDEKNPGMPHQEEAIRQLAKRKKILFQKGKKQKPLGAFDPKTLSIGLFKKENFSTFLHEAGHGFLEIQFALASKIRDEAASIGVENISESKMGLVRDTETLLNWFGVESMDAWRSLSNEELTSYHEKFARGFEKYLYEGTSPNIEMQVLFRRFRAWMIAVYKGGVDKHLKVELSDEVRGVYDRMLATDEQIKLTEQAQSLIPLFETADQGGMTPEAFAAYQALNQDASATAVEELQARSMKNMQWMHNAHNRATRKRKKEIKTLRDHMKMLVRSELIKQPVYRAYQFLTTKRGPNDKIKGPPKIKKTAALDTEHDTLLTAIAKLGGLNRKLVVSEWGIDPTESNYMPVFGKYLFRAGDNGVSIDEMRGLLAEQGYLDESDIHEFEIKFDESLHGRDHYSTDYDYEIRIPGDTVENVMGLNAGRLDYASLGEMGVPQDVIDKLEARKMTVEKGGIHPEIVSYMFTGEDPTDFMRQLAEAKPLKEAIQSETDARMLERYGDMSSPKELSSAADSAVHNSLRTRMVTIEANALAKLTGKPRIIAQAAKNFANNTIARLRLGELTTGQYSSAEARAARAAAKASKAGDIEKAATEKRNQVVLSYLTKAAHNAKIKTERDIKYLRKFSRKNVRKRLTQDYQDQIDKLLENIDLRQVSKRKLDRRASLDKWIQAQVDKGITPDIPDYLLNYKKSYKDMTVEEFQGLVDSVKQIESIGKRMRKLLVAKDKRELKAVTNQGGIEIRANGGKRRPEEKPGRFKLWQEGVRAAHRKLNSLLRQFDGGKSDGFMWNLVGRTKNELSDYEVTQKMKASKKLAEMYKPIMELKGGINGNKSKRMVPTIGKAFTRGQRIAYMLYWGSETGRNRILKGEGWRADQVAELFSTASEAEAKFVNDIWEYYDTFWPEIVAKQKRILAVAPKKVKNAPYSITTIDGKTINMRGGYHRIEYDRYRGANPESRTDSERAAEAADRALHGFTYNLMTDRGHLETRAEDVGMPLDRSLDVIDNHIGRLIHDLAWHEWLIDAYRIFDSKDIAGAIREHYGAATLHTIKDAIRSIASGDILPQDGVEVTEAWLRRNITRSVIGMSVTTGSLQPFGLFQAMTRNQTGAKWVLRGMARWIGDAARFRNAAAFAAEKSDFMYIRLKSTTNIKELQEISGRINHGQHKVKAAYNGILFYTVKMMQLVSDIPIWFGEYEKQMTLRPDDEARAIQLANEAVRSTQGTGETSDLSQVQIKHPMYGIFYNFFNTTYNLIAESTAMTNFKHPASVLGWMLDMAFLAVVPAIVPNIIMSLFRGDDNWDNWIDKMVKWEASYLLNLMVGVRELSGLIEGFTYRGPPASRIVTDVPRFLRKVGQGELNQALFNTGIRALGAGIGAPSTQLLRTYKGWVAWDNGEAPASSIFFGKPWRN